MIACLVNTLLNMPIANVNAGIWFRNAVWRPSNTEWRTDIPMSVFEDLHIRSARYALHDGPVIEVPMVDLRDALANTPERDQGRKVGPYDINPFARTVEGHRVQMSFGPFHDLNAAEIRDWHRRSSKPALRPPVDQEYDRMAEAVIERLKARRESYDEFVARIQELNPALTVTQNEDGLVSRREIAYALSINHLRTTKSFEDELLQEI